MNGTSPVGHKCILVLLVQLSCAQIAHAQDNATITDTPDTPETSPSYYPALRSRPLTPEEKLDARWEEYYRWLDKWKAGFHDAVGALAGAKLELDRFAGSWKSDALWQMRSSMDSLWSNWKAEVESVANELLPYVDGRVLVSRQVYGASYESLAVEEQRLVDTFTTAQRFDLVIRSGVNSHRDDIVDRMGRLFDAVIPALGIGAGEQPEPGAQERP
jgi:hypothetical protein